MDVLIAKALSFASLKHSAQRRKDEEASPYINHPIAVMNILRVEGDVSDTTVLVAALLHDTLEDTETTYDELAKTFGTHIADIVVELTDNQAVPRAERYAEQQDKALRYSHPARLVRLADKIANARDAIASPPPSWSDDRLKGHLQQSRIIVDILRGTHGHLEHIFDMLVSDKL